MDLQLGRVKFRHLIIAATCIVIANIAYAVVTEFDDIALDGDGSTPFVRFDHSSETSQFIVGFTDAIAFWSGQAYSVRFRRTASSNTLVVDGTGVGIGTEPSRALHVDGDALIEGNLEISSSRELKSDIEELSATAAMETLSGLTPVSFRYKATPGVRSLGFVAEDVPELVATDERKTLRTMDIVAVLTKALQEQQQQIDALSKQVLALQARIE